MPHSFIISATASNSGKTTVTAGLLRALRDNGHVVQPFKCGPDYIDPMFHYLASGRRSVNLDTFMSSCTHVKYLYNHYSEGADVCVVEGVMGLFDGYDKMNGSCAELSVLLDAPVVLVVNAKAMAYSVAPVLYGFNHFLPEIKIAGVIFNMVASENHESILRSACRDAGIDCLGCLRRNAELVIPGRHLGLTVSEKENMERLMTVAAKEVEHSVDIDKLLKNCL